MNRTILSLLIFSASGCGITGPDKVTLHFEGTVTAQATGQPIAGAQVTLFDAPRPFYFGLPELATTTTDAQGRYSLSTSLTGKPPCIEMAALELVVGATASGFSGEAKQVEQCTQLFDFVLAPATTP